jgi:hypothetical protein
MPVAGIGHCRSGTKTVAAMSGHPYRLPCWFCPFSYKGPLRLCALPA